MPVGETFELSLIFFGGLTQDIRFTAGDTTAKTIRISKDSNHLQRLYHSEFSPISDRRVQQEVTAMMIAMFEDKPRTEGVKDKYYVTDTNRILKKTDQFQITQIKAYRYKDLSGAILEVKNISKSTVNALEEDFRGLFRGTLVINLKSTMLVPKAKTFLFIVTRGGINDSYGTVNKVNCNL